jgi:hypothetical protein
MVHPGERSDDADDPIRAARYLELDYLRSAEFGEQLQSAAVELTRPAFSK